MISQDHRRISRLAGKQNTHSVVLPDGINLVSGFTSDWAVLQAPTNDPEPKVVSTPENHESSPSSKEDTDEASGGDLFAAQDSDSPCQIKSVTQQIDDLVKEEVQPRRERRVEIPKPQHSFSLLRSLCNPRKFVDPLYSEPFAKLQVSFKTCEGTLVNVLGDRPFNWDAGDARKLFSSLLPYAVLGLDGKDIYRTRVVPFTTARAKLIGEGHTFIEEWAESVEVRLYHPSSLISLKLYDRDTDVNPSLMHEMEETTKDDKNNPGCCAYVSSNKLDGCKTLLGRTSFKLSQFQYNLPYKVICTAQFILPESESLIHRSNEPQNAPSYTIFSFHCRKRGASNTQEYSPLLLPAFEAFLKLEIEFMLLPQTNTKLPPLFVEVILNSVTLPKAKKPQPPFDIHLSLLVLRRTHLLLSLYFQNWVAALSDILLFDVASDSIICLLFFALLVYRRCLFSGSLLSLVVYYSCLVAASSSTHLTKPYSPLTTVDSSVTTSDTNNSIALTLTPSPRAPAYSSDQKHVDLDESMVKEFGSVILDELHRKPLRKLQFQLFKFYLLLENLHELLYKAERKNSLHATHSREMPRAMVLKLLKTADRHDVITHIHELQSAVSYLSPLSALVGLILLVMALVQVSLPYLAKWTATVVVMLLFVPRTKAVTRFCLGVSVLRSSLKDSLPICVCEDEREDALQLTESYPHSTVYGVYV